MTDDEMTGEELGEKLLESIRQMKAGEGTVVYSPAIAARRRSGLSQAQFAALLGVSVRMLQEWEQGRRQPSGAAKTLFKRGRAPSGGAARADGVRLAGAGPSVDIGRPSTDVVLIRPTPSAQPTAEPPCCRRPIRAGCRRPSGIAAGAAVRGGVG